VISITSGTNKISSNRVSIKSKKRAINRKKEDTLLYKSFLKFSDELIGTRKNGLGRLYKAYYKDVEIADRIICFDRLSRYDLEGLSIDIEEIMYIHTFSRFYSFSFKSFL